MKNFFKEMNLGWRLYFGLLGLILAIFIGVIIYFALTLELNSPEGGAIVFLGLYLVFYIGFVTTNLALYAIGAKVPFLRKLLAVAASVLVGFTLLQFVAYGLRYL